MKKINFLIHLLEFKYRLLYILVHISFFIIIFVEYKVELFFYISEFFLTLQKQFIYTNILDPIYIYIKLIVTNILLFSLPFILYVFNFYLSKHIHNIYIKIYNIFLLVLFFSNFLFYYIFLNLVVKFIFLFLLSFQRNQENILLQFQLEATIQQYFSFFLFLILLNIILFFIPLILFFIINLSSSANSFLKKFSFRKYIYFLLLLCFIFFAPPDFIVQLSIFPLLLFIVEFYIYLLFFFNLLNKQYTKYIR